MRRAKLIGVGLLAAVVAMGALLAGAGLAGPVGQTSAGVSTTSASEADLRLLSSDGAALVVTETGEDDLPPLTVTVQTDANGAAVLYVSDPLASVFGSPIAAGVTWEVPVGALGLGATLRSAGGGTLMDLASVASEEQVGGSLGERRVIDSTSDRCLVGHGGGPDVTLIPGSVVSQYSGGKELGPNSPINILGVLHAVVRCGGNTLLVERPVNQSRVWVNGGSAAPAADGLRAAGADHLPSRLVLSFVDDAGAPSVEIVEGLTEEQIDPAACQGVPWECVEEELEAATVL